MNDHSSKFVLFSYGFRPFFLLAALHAIIVLSLWLYIFFTGYWWNGNLTAQLWHGHEMLFGFVEAAIAGFLLTAVPAWTGKRAISGWPLFILVLAWLTGRLIMVFYSLFSVWIVSIVDLAFFPLLGVMLFPSLSKGKPRNMIFLLLLATLFTANLLFHIAIANNNTLFASNNLLFGVNTVLVLISIIGGRIIPAFTQGAMQRTDATFTIKPFPALDRIAILSILIILVTDLFWPYSITSGWLAIIAALLHAIRFARWKTFSGQGEAIVLILHVAYAWLIIGLVLKGLFLVTGLSFSTGWLHAFTVGAFATMIMAVMTRASLGHTGRPLVAPPLVKMSYVFITLAAIVRVTGPAFPESYSISIAVSGMFWIIAFTLFLIVYIPILVTPRVESLP